MARSMLAFWMGGASSPIVVSIPPIAAGGGGQVIRDKVIFHHHEPKKEAYKFKRNMELQDRNDIKDIITMVLDSDLLS